MWVLSPPPGMWSETTSAALQHILDRVHAQRAHVRDVFLGHVHEVVEHDLHAKGRMRPLGRRDADPAHADDAERLAAQAGAHHVRGPPARPFAGAQLALALAGTPRQHQHQRQRQCPRCSRSGTPGVLVTVRPALLRGGDVDMVESHTEVAKDLRLVVPLKIDAGSLSGTVGQTAS